LGIRESRLNVLSSAGPRTEIDRSLRGAAGVPGVVPAAAAAADGRTNSDGPDCTGPDQQRRRFIASAGRTDSGSKWRGQPATYHHRVGRVTYNGLRRRRRRPSKIHARGSSHRVRNKNDRSSAYRRAMPRPEHAVFYGPHIEHLYVYE